MNRRLYWVLMTAIACVAACSAGCTEADPALASQNGQVCQEDSWRARYLALGRETYETACASCHDEDKGDGAPIKGDKDSWSTRSPLWSAVLLEHAKSGYMDMPTKGGKLELSDRVVEAAGEYMLHETFPELPRD